MSLEKGMELATIGGGCFWCLEPIFEPLAGIKDATVGYAGGERPNPTYQQICTGATGHAEVVQIVFDPQIISYKEILYHFFATHDPTTLNRQGNDRGSQYRSVIFYHNSGQRQVAEEVMSELSVANLWSSEIVTELTEAPEFYRAEDYHQRYFELNPDQPYCRAIIAPKVVKFRASLKNSGKD
ncbi:MAG: peptide-methionine (S)-S-oxide reductase MsrA [Gammaproteobacteria bacterium]|nr:peptide-methionine (S)-S-oxide reductase MsrA [Gammaproteobacteria bacterium]